jgi:hypothetical protein
MIGARHSKVLHLVLGKGENISINREEHNYHQNENP